MKILVTGSTGFVGRRFMACAEERATMIALPSAHDRRAHEDHRRKSTHLGALSPDTDWSPAVKAIDAVLHLAARVHIMRDEDPDPIAAFRHINTAGTLNLARQAAAAGVRRFVFVSSVKVNGESTAPGRAFRHDDVPRPEDAYGVSKREAEDGLRELAAATGMEVVIVRPPLVYGPGVKANFAALVRAVQRGLPLPLGAVTHNRRSFVALDNLVDLLITCLEHPAAANQTVLASDGEDLSTADLLQRLGRALGRPVRLLPVPPPLLRFAASVLGKGDEAQRLLSNLQVDITHTRETLGWRPPITVDEGLRRTVAGLGQA